MNVAFLDHITKIIDNTVAKYGLNIGQKNKLKIIEIVTKVFVERIFDNKRKTRYSGVNPKNLSDYYCNVFSYREDGGKSMIKLSKKISSGSYWTTESENDTKLGNEFIDFVVKNKIKERLHL